VEIDKLIEGADIGRFIKALRVNWLGHIQRMDRARPTGKLLDWKPMGNRPVGRPRQRWQEDVMEDVKVKHWKETAKDRKIWRDLAEKTKTHKLLKCQMMIATLEMRDLQWFNRKRILELPVLLSSFKDRKFEIDDRDFAVSYNSLTV
jgi:hypothetical protein